MKLVNYGYLPAGVFGLALTGTRTALLALFPAAIYMIWSLSAVRLSRRVIALTLLVIAGVLLASFLPQASAQRLGTTFSELSSGDFSSRAEIWSQGVEAFLERPVAGVGAGAFRRAVARGQVAHNTLISVLTETGLVGLVPFVIAVLIAFRCAGRHLRRERRFWMALLWGVAIGASSLTWETTKVSWLFTGLVVASAANNGLVRSATRGRHSAPRSRGNRKAF
jgi:O-antigen ligase